MISNGAYPALTVANSNTSTSAYAIKVTAGRSELGSATVKTVPPTTLNLQSLTIGAGGLKVTGAAK